MQWCWAEEVMVRPEPDRPGGTGGDPAALKGQHRAAGPGRWREAACQEEARRSAGEGGEARRSGGVGVSSFLA